MHVLCKGLVTFTKLDLGDLMNEDKMDSTCSTYGGKEKCTQVISRE